jgi:hypothetical protein
VVISTPFFDFKTKRAGGEGCSKIDRCPWAGFSGTFYFGEVAADTGSFIRYASELGMKCLWFSEKDEDLHAAAQAEAGPTAGCCDMPW